MYEEGKVEKEQGGPARSNYRWALLLPNSKELQLFLVNGKRQSCPCA
jgi:hypothetical protein